MLKFTVISETDIFGKIKKKKKRKTYEGRKILSFTELKPGDYVVHENHGLGIYQGIEKVEVEKIVKDYIKIEYRDGGNLYILATLVESAEVRPQPSSSLTMAATVWEERKPPLPS